MTVRRPSRLALVVCLFSSLACSDEGPSGVAGEKQLEDLTTSEMFSLCAWVITEMGGEGASFRCSNDGTITNDTFAECVEERDEYIGCDLTVDDMEACVLAAGPNPCDIGVTPECDPLLDCVIKPAER